jgi:hypothetical protein
MSSLPPNSSRKNFTLFKHKPRLPSWLRGRSSASENPPAADVVPANKGNDLPANKGNERQLDGSKQPAKVKIHSSEEPSSKIQSRSSLDPSPEVTSVQPDGHKESTDAESPLLEQPETTKGPLETGSRSDTGLSGEDSQPKDLWDRAYEQLWQNSTKLVERYDLVSRPVRDSCSCTHPHSRRYCT